MSNSKDIKSREKRATLSKLATAGGAVAIAGLSSKTWVKPTVDAVMLPAHAQTSACMDGDNLVLEVTSTDLSTLELELYSVGGGSVLLFQISPGDLSGSGTQVVYDECQPEDACYEAVLRDGSGTATLRQGATSEMRDFPPVPTSLTVGTTCS